MSSYSDRLQACQIVREYTVFRPSGLKTTLNATATDGEGVVGY